MLLDVQFLLNAMNHKAHKENNKEMMCVPEHFIVRPPVDIYTHVDVYLHIDIQTNRIMSIEDVIMRNKHMIIIWPVIPATTAVTSNNMCQQTA